MAVGRLIDNGWASMMALYGYARKRYTIMSPYITKDNSAAEDTVFAPGSFCPLEKNKWICAFLPTTNCSFPRAFTDCEPETKDVNKCLEKVFFFPFLPPTHIQKTIIFLLWIQAFGTIISQSSVFFDHASIGGKLITKKGILFLNMYFYFFCKNVLSHDQNKNQISSIELKMITKGIQILAIMSLTVSI